MKMMKWFTLLFLLLAVVVIVPAQNVNYSSATMTYMLQCTKDTVAATDSTLYCFYAPYNMQVINVTAISGVTDTGSAGSAGKVSLAKGASITSATTEVAAATVTTAKTLYYGTPSTSALSRIAKGQYVKVVGLLGTGDKLIKLTVVVHYVRY